MKNGTSSDEMPLLAGSGDYIRFSTGKTHNQTGNFKLIDWAALVEMVRNPPIDLSHYTHNSQAKNNCHWLLPCNAPRKTKDAVLSHNQFNALIVDKDKGEPFALDEMEFNLAIRFGVGRYAIYSTIKHRISEPKKEGEGEPIQYGNRWRVIIPLAEVVDHSRWHAAQQFLAEWFEGDSCVDRSQQISYLPARYRGPYEHAISEGQPLNLNDPAAPFTVELNQWQQRKQKEAEATPAPRQPLKMLPGQLSVIDAYNEQADVAGMVQRKCGEQKRDGYWLHPASESGSAGIVLLNGRYFSHHSKKTDSLADGHTHDAFDLFVHWEHGGVFNAALKAAGDRLLTDAGITISQHNQRAYRQQQTAEELAEMGKESADQILDHSDQPDDSDELAENVEAEADPLADIPQMTRKEIAALIDETDDFDELTDRIAKIIIKSDLKESERLSLRKFVAKKAGVSVASLKEDAKPYEVVAVGAGEKHLYAAWEVVKSYGSGNLIYALSQFWRWSGKVWRTIDDREVKRKIHAVAEGFELTANVVNSILDMVKTEVNRPDHQFDQNAESIPVENGELVPNGHGWRLLKHDRERYRTTLLPVTYDPSATAPRFAQFMDEIFAPDNDHAEKKRIVAQALGYTLHPSTHLEKFFMLIGSGANGKSVLLAVLAELVGSGQVSAISPDQLENRFQLAHLHGKLCNIVTEIAEGAELNDAKLKALVSGEIQTAEHKNKPPFEFKPFAKHWYGTNHLPRTRDFSDALFRRAIILTFNRQFNGSDRDPHLTEKLKAELPGILNFALAGLNELRHQRAFTEAGSTEAIKREWRMESDQAAQFIDECVTRSLGAKEQSGSVYQAYKVWAQLSGITKPLGRNSFTARVKRLGFAAEKGTGGTRYIYGLAINHHAINALRAI
jgi:P4 family phage/plasmid primase-like protien